MSRRLLPRLAPPPEPTSGPAPVVAPAAEPRAAWWRQLPSRSRLPGSKSQWRSGHPILFEPMAEWAPDIVSGVVAPAAEPITFAWVEVRTTGVNERVLDLNSEGGTGNHWIPLRGDPHRMARTPHLPCAEILCGGVGRRCMSAIAESFARLRWAPANLPADGDCLFTRRSS